MGHYQHISPDGKKRRCANPAKCRFKPVENNSHDSALNIPEAVHENGQKAIRNFHSLGMSVQVISSVRDMKKPHSQGATSLSRHSELEFLTEDVKADKEEILSWWSAR